MPLDPNIFFQAAALENQNANNLQSQLAEGIRLYAAGKQKKKEGLDVGKLAEDAAYKKAAGLELTPEEDALAMGWDKIQSSSMALDPLGRPYQKQRSIFGDLAQSSGQGYTPSYSAGEMPTPPPGGAFPDKPSDYNTVPLDDAALNELFEGNVPKGLDVAQFVDQPEPIRDTPRSVVEGLGGRLDANNPEVLKNDIEAQKQIIVDEAKARTDQKIKQEDLQKTETATLPVLQRMLELNDANSAEMSVSRLR